ncbi:MAG: hypothetical protein ACI4M5_00960 [Christensenellales bacterium]
MKRNDVNKLRIRLYACNIKSALQLEKYWWVYLVTAIISIVGLIIGIMIGKNIDKPDQFAPYQLLSLSQYSYFSNFLKISLYFALVIFIAFLSIFNPTFALFSLCTAIFVGYRIGYLITVSFNVNVATAILSLLLYYLPLWIAFLTVIATQIIFNLNYNNCIKSINWCKNLIIMSGRTALFLFILAVLVALILCVLLPLIFNVLFF